MTQSKITDAETALRNAELFDSLADEVQTLLYTGDVNGALELFNKLTEIQNFGTYSTYLAIKKQIAKYCILSKYNYITQTKSIANNSASSPCFSPDGKTILTSYYSLVKLWDVETGQCIRTFIFGKKKGNNPFLVCFSPNGKAALSANEDNIVSLWDTDTGRCIQTFKVKVNAICFSLNGKMLLSGNVDHTVNVWDVATGASLHSFEGHEDSITSVSFSPNGKKALSGSHDYTVRLWDLETGECRYIYPSNKIQSVSFSPDGKLALFSGWGGLLQLWDLDTWNCIHTLKGHGEEDIVQACFSPNGKMVLSYCNTNLMLWDIASEKCVYKFDQLRLPACSACFSPDGTQILLRNGGGEIVIFDFDYDLEFPGWHYWDENACPACPYLDTFLALYPNPTNNHFWNILIPDLQNRGYGWLRPNGVIMKLDEIQFGW